MNEVTTQETLSAENTAKAVYILYLVGVLIPVTGIVGVVLAYVNIDDAPPWLRSHYQFQIRTFWIGGIYLIIGALLAIFIIGYVVLLFWTIWLIVRCAKGLKSLDRKLSHPDPTGWML